MKSYKIIRRNMELHKQLSTVLRTHDRYRGSYFWNPPSSASQRSAMEFETHLKFSYKEEIYEIIQSVSCSCRNIYYHCSIYQNDKKKDIRIVKKLLGVK